jgi:hypothetical protein
MVDRRLRSKAYKQRSVMAALQNVEPVRPSGFLSRRFDKPRRSSPGIMSYVRAKEDRKMRRADFARREASWIEFRQYRDKTRYNKGITIDAKTGEPIVEHFSSSSYSPGERPTGYGKRRYRKRVRMF